MATRPAHIVTVDTTFTRSDFDASYLFGYGDEYAFVDTGTNASVPHLLSVLEKQGISPTQVRYVFLTHVHLDHAGGAGILMQQLPNATAVLHPRGVRHMADPTRCDIPSHLPRAGLFSFPG